MLTASQGLGQPAPTRGEALAGWALDGSSSQLPLNNDVPRRSPPPGGPTPRPGGGARSFIKTWVIERSIPFGNAFGIPIRWHILLPVILVLKSLWGFSISWAVGVLLMVIYGPILWGARPKQQTPRSAPQSFSPQSSRALRVPSFSAATVRRP